MTTIAWDGSTLAADKLAMVGDSVFYTRKVYKIRGCLTAYTGTAAIGEALLHWFADGADPGKFPAQASTADNNTRLVVIRPEGPVQVFEMTPYPVKFERNRFAAGAGRDHAMTAMYLGKTATEAVEVANALTVVSRGGWDARTFEDPDDGLDT